ncbi:beta-propeller fold lactonase family protein [Burkholderia ubonensis]|uniref:beta-propeller fold lactonase family protein n=1 Tax=Burkholderia ubonensis TaxID=101571 RepID=UPI0018E02253|nr:beta-propeller fold lactonase family protein [Burkholderia ubonensis]
MDDLQLAFQIVNDAGGTPVPNVIYITSDASYNKVSLQVQLSARSTQLSPGTIPAPETPPSSGTTLYIDLSALQLSATVWDALSLSADDWTFKTFPDEGVFGMTPTKPITFYSGTAGVIKIEIDGITVPEPLSQTQQQLYATYYGVPDVDGMNSTFAVVLQNRPDGGEDLSKLIAVSLSANGIVNSPPPLKACNAFALQFSSNQQLQVTAGPDTLFTVGFVYGGPQDKDGFGALTNVPSAQQIEATKGLNAEQWIMKGYKNVESPYWTLQPPANAPIVGTGAQSIVEIDFANVVTPYQPGPTVMLVSYTKVPGYRDGAFALVLNKVAHAQIISLQVVPNPTCFSDGSANVTVSWKTANAQALLLTQNFKTTPVTGLTQIPAVLDAESTTFTLHAIGAPGTVENEDFKSVTAIALPVVNSFVGTPTEIFSGSLSHDAAFAWSVDSTDGVTLSSTGGAFSGQTFNPVGSTTVSIDEPQMITLAPTTAVNPLTLTRRLVISAFTPTPASYSPSPAPGAVAVSPAGPFVLTGAAGASGLNVLDTVSYTSIGSVLTGHNAVAIAFSSDGSLVATANTDNTVSIISVSQGSNGLPEFGAAKTVTLGAPPRALTFSANGPRVFVVVDGASQGQAGQVASIRNSGGVWGIEGTVTVGQKPVGLTVDAAGSRLFVANSGDDTVTTVGLTQDGALGGTATIHNVPGAPTGIAASPSGQQLLVSCATTGAVLVLDPNHPETGQRKTLAVGRSPGQMSITPNGVYAFVVNTADGTVSLIDCSGLPAHASVAGGPITVGGQPASIAVSPEGLQVLVGTGANLAVVTLASYEASSNIASIPNRPTSVESFVDGSAVFAWHDASIPSSVNPGILVSTVQPTAPRNVLADKNVLRCVASPDPRSGQAFAIVQSDPTLYVIDIESLTPTPQPLRLDAGAAPVALAISGEGDTVWIIAKDGKQALSLAELTLSTANGNPVWTQTQNTVPLFQTTAYERILLRATPDGTTLFVVETVAAQAHVIRHTGHAYTLLPRVIAGDVSIIDLAVQPDGRTAYLLNQGSDTNTITVIDVASLGSHVAAVPQKFVNLRALQPSPDGRKLFAVDTSAAALRVVDPLSLRIVQTIPMQNGGSTLGSSSALSVAPDGSRIFIAHTDSQKVSFVEQIQMGVSQNRKAKNGAGGAEVLTAEAAYSGLFMRHDIDDTPQTPTSGWSASPDVIPFGLAIAGDLSIFTSADGYKNPFNRDVITSNLNYVYVRGLNTTDAPITSRAYFYYTPGSLAMWPANWSTAGVMVNNDPTRNWVDVSAPVANSESNGVGVGALPIQWTPPPIDVNTDHYCVVAWVDNSANPQPPDFSEYEKFSTFDDLVQFVSSHHNMAWRNTHDVNTPPPDFRYNSLLAMKSGGGAVYLTVNFDNVPLDGTFAVNVQGTNAQNTVALGKSALSDYQGGFQPKGNPLVYPPNFQTSVQISHWPGATPLPDNAKIIVTISVQTAPELMFAIERRYRAMNLRSPFRVLNGIPLFTIGTTQFNLLFGADGANAKLEIAR